MPAIAGADYPTTATAETVEYVEELLRRRDEGQFLTSFERIRLTIQQRRAAIEQALDSEPEFATALGGAEAEYRKLVDREAGKALFFERNAPELPEYECGTADVLFSAAPDPDPIIEGLLPMGGRHLNNAQRKAGKTTLVLNMLNSLTTGEKFLGRFEVQQQARVGYLNYELTPGSFTQYAKGLLERPECVWVLHLAGRTNPLAAEKGRAWLAQALRDAGVSVLAVDPLSVAVNGCGISLSNNDEARQWLDELHRWAIEDAGLIGLWASHHSGWSGERSRGASAIEDWPDAISGLRLEDEQVKSSARYFDAFGRLGTYDEDLLSYDATTGRMGLTGKGSRRHNKTADKASEIHPDVVTTFADFTVRMNTTELKASLGLGASSEEHKALSTVLKQLTTGSEPYLRVEKGPKNSKVYSRIDHEAELFAEIGVSA